MALNGVAIDRYRMMAKDYIQSKNMVLTYAKFHPKIKSRNVLEASASRVLSNVNFNRIKEEIVREMEPDLEKNINQCLNTLLDLSSTAERKADRISAAQSYLKFTIGEKSRSDITINDKPMLAPYSLS